LTTEIKQTAALPNDIPCHELQRKTLCNPTIGGAWSLNSYKDDASLGSFPSIVFARLKRESA
jgi:hypothetical protein